MGPIRLDAQAARAENRNSQLTAAEALRRIRTLEGTLGYSFKVPSTRSQPIPDQLLKAETAAREALGFATQMFRDTIRVSIKIATDAEEYAKTARDEHADASEAARYAQEATSAASRANIAFLRAQQAKQALLKAAGAIREARKAIPSTLSSDAVDVGAPAETELSQ